MAAQGAPEADTTGNGHHDDEAADDEYLQRQHEHLSQIIERTLRRADALFSGNKSLDSPTGSYVQFIGRTVQQRAHDGTDQYDLVPRAKLNLPHTSERLQLFLEQDLPNAGRSEAQRDAQAAAASSHETRANTPACARSQWRSSTCKPISTAACGFAFRSILSPARACAVSSAWDRRRSRYRRRSCTAARTTPQPHPRSASCIRSATGVH